MRNLFTLTLMALMVTGCVEANPFYEGNVVVVLGDTEVPSATNGGILGDDAETRRPASDTEVPQSDAAAPDAAPDSDSDFVPNNFPSQDVAYETIDMLSPGCYMEEGSDTLPVGLGRSHDPNNCVTIDLNREVTVTLVKITAVRASANKSEGEWECLIPCEEAPSERGCSKDGDGNLLDGSMSIALSVDNVVWTNPTTIEALWENAEGTLENTAVHTVEVGSTEARYIRVCRIPHPRADTEAPGLIIDAVEEVE